MAGIFAQSKDRHLHSNNIYEVPGVVPCTLAHQPWHLRVHGNSMCLTFPGLLHMSFAHTQARTSRVTLYAGCSLALRGSVAAPTPTAAAAAAAAAAAGRAVSAVVEAAWP